MPRPPSSAWRHESPYALALLDHLLRCLQQYLIGKDGQVLADPLPADHACFIDEKECPPGMPAHGAGILNLRAGGAVHDPVRLDDLQVHIAEQRVRQRQRVRERLLGKRVVVADPEELNMQGLELAVVGLPGREVRHSDRRKILGIELEEHQLLPPELTQADLRPQGAGEREVRRLLPDLQGRSHRGAHQHARQQHAH